MSVKRLVKRMGEGGTGGASDMKRWRVPKDPKVTGGLVSKFSHPRVNKTHPRAPDEPQTIRDQCNAIIVRRVEVQTSFLESYGGNEE